MRIRYKENKLLHSRLLNKEVDNSSSSSNAAYNVVCLRQDEMLKGRRRHFRMTVLTYLQHSGQQELQVFDKTPFRTTDGSAAAAGGNVCREMLHFIIPNHELGEWWLLSKFPP